MMAEVYRLRRAGLSARKIAVRVGVRMESVLQVVRAVDKLEAARGPQTADSLPGEVSVAQECSEPSPRFPSVSQPLPALGDAGYALKVADAAFVAGLMTPAEHRELLRLDALMDLVQQRPVNARVTGGSR